MKKKLKRKLSREDEIGIALIVILMLIAFG